MYAFNSSKTLDVVDDVNVSFEGKFDGINAFNETGIFDETSACDGISSFDELGAFNETGTYDETVKFDERDKFEFDCSFKDVFNAFSVSLASS